MIGLLQKWHMGAYQRHFSEMRHATNAFVGKCVDVGVPNGDSSNTVAIRQQHMAPYWIDLSRVYDQHNRLETETHPRIGLNAGQIT